MILVYPLSEKPNIIRKSFELQPDVFIKARDFYHRNKDMRHHKVIVYGADGPKFVLGWIKNDPINIDKNNPMVQMHLSNYWEYSQTDEGLDFSYVDRYQLIIYEELEEYSYHTARMILEHNPGMIIAFTDSRASYFFEENEHMVISDTEEELFEKHPEFKSLKTLRGNKEIRWDVQGVFRGIMSSLEIMTSMYWLKREFYYGPKNPDKTFYLIKQPVKENGLTALIANVIGVKQMVRYKRPDFIPVVDLGIANDPNQFAGTSGEDVWTMFFKPISSVSLKEVYDSQHVILDQNSNLNLNPYLTEFVFTNQRAELKYGDDLQYRDEIVQNTNEVLDKIFPTEKNRILAVVVRGTDYNAPQAQNYVPHGMTPEATLKKAIDYVYEKKFDYVYLATEDTAVLDLFSDSELKDKLLYVPQDRIDYRKEENKDMLLLEIFGREKSDPYTRTLNYIAVLEGLVRCDALLANVTCGAVTYALGRGRDYEFIDVETIDIRR